MHVLDTSRVDWSIAKKTQSLRAKPMVTLLVDRAVMSRFLVDTLEAREPVSADAMFCIGQTNDAWQQTAKKLLAKYNVESIDAEGWMVCVPKPENSVEFFEVTQAHFAAAERVEAGDADHYLQGIWGAKVGGRENLQRVRVGDFVARNREDTDDQWVVARRIWQNSYTALQRN